MSQKEKREIAREAFECWRAMFPLEDIRITDPESTDAPLNIPFGNCIALKQSAKKHVIAPGAASHYGR